MSERLRPQPKVSRVIKEKHQLKLPRKNRKGELTLAQFEQNLEMAAGRIFVEHLIRVVKIFRIASERFRLNSWKYEQIIMTICGIVRLRIEP